MTRPAVTPEQYTQAIERLANTGLQTTGAGEAAARVLLSAYDYTEWGFDAGDLTRLHDGDRDAALTVLQACAELGEPQHYAPSRDDASPERLFHDLWNIWRGSDQEMAS